MPLPEPSTQNLAGSTWTVRPVGDLAHVPASIPRHPLPAAIPGCIHSDLLRAHLITHPDQGMAELDQLWIGRTNWEYRCTFDADEPLFAHDRADLVFECLDTIAAITLNGTVLGHAASAFIPHRFDTRKSLRRGTNELVITFTAPITHIHAEDARLGPLPRNGDWDPFNTIRKPACDFGWDWGPKTATSGIPGPVKLEGWSYVRLDNVRTLVRRASEHEWTVEVIAAMNWTGPPRDGPVVLIAHLEARALEEGPARYAQATSVGVANSRASLTLRVTDPPLWWPRGYGEATLHEMTVRLQSADGSHTYGVWSGKVGFRTVDLDTSPDRDGERFALRVNGREVFCIGANWIPPALFEDHPPRVSPTQCPGFVFYSGAELLRNAAAANINMLRVWGGGRFEPDRFYSDCDELGILVWQDFMFACALYAEEEPLRSLIEREARHHVTRLSSHPSVVLYCGGNETIWGYQRWGWKERVPPGRTWGSAYWTRLLPAVVSELDPTRPYWPNSPWSGSLDHDTLDPSRGDRHTWDAEFEGYRATTPRFLSEFGRQGPANHATLARAIGPAHLRVGSREFEHRQRATGGTPKVINEAIETYFGKTDRSFDEWHYLAQLLQARAVKIGVSWARCNRPRCSGVLLWQLNDVWACPSWSLIDAKDRLKPAYYAFKKAAAARGCFFHGDPTNTAAGPRLHAINDTDEPWETTILLRRIWLGSDAGSAEPARVDVRVSLAPRSAGIIGTAAALVGAPSDVRQEMLVLDVPTLGPSARDTWLFVADRELVEPLPRWRVAPRRVGNDLHLEALTLMRDVIVQVDRIDPVASIEDHVFTLLPGERTAVTAKSLANPTMSLFDGPPIVWCAGLRSRV